jgi:hypothetical protein
VRPSLPSPVDHLFAALQKVHSGALGRLEQSSSIRFKSGVPPDSTSVVKPPGEEPNIPTREGSRGWCHGKERQLTEVRLREHNLDRPMSPKTPSSMIAVLLILVGAVFGVLGGLHAVYTLLDLSRPRRLVPVDPSVAQAMSNSAVRLSGGGTDMWRAWIGFNFNHSLVPAICRACDLGRGPNQNASRRHRGSADPDQLRLHGSPCVTGFVFLPSGLPLVPPVSPQHGFCRCADSSPPVLC